MQMFRCFQDSISKHDFLLCIDQINLLRAKITALIFIFLEIIMIILYISSGKSNPPYFLMYITMFTMMTVFLIGFTILGINPVKNDPHIRFTGAVFSIFILLWCAGISLLDQLSNGQIIVYSIAAISIAAVPIYEPVVTFFIYFSAHIAFLILLPRFQSDSSLLFANIVNSSAFIILSWAISYMRYRYQIEDFNNKKQLEILSQTDSLTGLFNRLTFDKKIREKWDICKIINTPLSLIMADIDYFKSYNDTYGHQAGDICIKKIANVISDFAKDKNVIAARYGGEEFIILVCDIDEEGAYTMAEDIRKNVENLDIIHDKSDVSSNLTLSLGVFTVIPNDTMTIEGFIGETDKNLYRAKEKRNVSFARDIL